jgi:hypothetical protein
MCSLLHFAENFNGLAINHLNVAAHMVLSRLAVCRLQADQRSRLLQCVL